MKKTIVFALCVSALVAGATQYSKLALITAAKQAGRWDALKAWIASAGLQDEFQNCVYLSDGSQQQLAPVEGEAPVPSSNLSVQQNPNEGE